MGKTIINVSNPFFEMDGKEGDVLYSFTGKCGHMGSNNVLRGKTVNLSKMYDNMLDDVREFLFGGEFAVLIDKSDAHIVSLVSKYTFKKYGIGIQCVYSKINGKTTRTNRITTDIIFSELKAKYGITEIDWMYLYNNVTNFRTNDADIVKYIGNKILSNEIYEYFVTEYNLRTVGVCVLKQGLNEQRHKTHIQVEWNNGSRDIHLSRFVRSYKHWWMVMTANKDKNRSDIRDYDVLLNGRSVKEVFPVYCPVFSNLRMNYTGIDFDGKNNIKKCSEIAGYNDKGETWSLASIDRIDSSKGYSYDNIRIISQYANGLKNVGSKEQIIRLGDYLKNNNPEQNMVGEGVGAYCI